MSGFTREQVDQLLRAINPKRVSTDGKGFSHVEAYDIRAHLTRIFGFGNWDTEVTMLEQVYESSEMKRRKNKQGEEYGDPYEAWTVCYRARMRLTVRSYDGEVCSSHEDGATGEATHQPSRGDAHDLALKTACSQALKRAAVNWGDNFGLSLYAKGSKSALVRRTIVMPDAEATTDEDAVDAHITEPLPREDEAHEPEPEPRITNHQPAVQPTLEPAPEPASADLPDPAEREAQRKQAEAERIRQAAVDGPPEDWSGTPVRWISHLMGEAVKAKVQNVQVESLLSPNPVALRVMLEQRMKQLADEQRVAS